MDTLADMLNAIKNAGRAGKKHAVVPYSNFKQAVAKALFDAGYIFAYEKLSRSKGGDLLQIEVKYFENNIPKINNLKRISKLSCRIYSGHKDFYTIRQGYGHIFVSTPKGVMTSVDARKAHVGGEVLFEIW